MDISKQFSIIKVAYEEFKVLVGEHPIATIALTILFPVGVAVTCVWGVRKVIILNLEDSKPKIENKPLEVKVAETTVQPTGTWNKTHIALGALAAFGLGAVIYSYYQSPAEIVKIVKPIPFLNPFQSSINSTVCSLFDNIQDVQKPISDVISSLPKSLPFTGSDLNPICHLTENVIPPAGTFVKSISDALPSGVIPTTVPVPLPLPATTAPMTALFKWMPNPFQSSALHNSSSIYNLVVDNTSALIKNINALNPPVAAPVVNNPIVETVKNVVKSDAFSFADKMRLAATQSVLLGILYDKLYPLKRRNTPILAAAQQPKPPTSAWTYLPSVGILGGTIVGTIANLWHNQSIYAKTSMLCAPIKQWPVLSKINLVQQGVTKALGLGFNLIPGAIVLIPALGVAGYKYLRSNNNVEKLESKELVGRISVDVAKTTLMSLMTIVCKQIIKLNYNSFDPSGHIMLKAAGLHGLMASQKYINDPVTRTVSSLFVLYSTVTDSLFLANTAGCFHTPLDIIAGSVYALGIYTLTNRMVDSAVDYYHRRQDSYKITISRIKNKYGQDDDLDVKMDVGFELQESKFNSIAINFKGTDNDSDKYALGVDAVAKEFVNENFENYHEGIEQILGQLFISTEDAKMIIGMIAEKINQEKTKI